MKTLFSEFIYYENKKVASSFFSAIQPAFFKSCGKSKLFCRGKQIKSAKRGILSTKQDKILSLRWRKDAKK
ncbi:hypothetical protein, partial [Bacteroides heparinolyticus]|uniref:hypothetical protein n=1 Tax=Prevotella heparinolytica TaxID=28113 RepID=UPI00359F3DFC